MEQKLITIKDGKKFEAILTIADEPPPWIWLRFEGYDWGKVEGITLNSCLRLLHQQLDTANVQLLCNGCRYDVRPSAMADHEMGRLAYRLVPGRHALSDDLVNIFDPTDDVGAILTVQEKDEFYLKYLEGFGIDTSKSRQKGLR